jgi:hypothetical protein
MCTLSSATKFGPSLCWCVVRHPSLHHPRYAAAIGEGAAELVQLIAGNSSDTSAAVEAWLNGSSSDASSSVGGANSSSSSGSSSSSQAWVNFTASGAGVGYLLTNGGTAATSLSVCQFYSDYYGLGGSSSSSANSTTAPTSSYFTTTFTTSSSSTTATTTNTTNIGDVIISTLVSWLFWLDCDAIVQAALGLDNCTDREPESTASGGASGSGSSGSGSDSGGTLCDEALLESAIHWFLGLAGGAALLHVLLVVAVCNHARFWRLDEVGR